MPRINLKSRDVLVRQIGLAALKWRDSKAKPTKELIAEIIVDIDYLGYDLQIVGFPFIVTDADRRWVRMSVLHLRRARCFDYALYLLQPTEAADAPVRTCGEMFQRLCGFHTAWVWHAQGWDHWPHVPGPGDFWHKDLNSQENRQLFERLQAAFDKAHPDLMDEEYRTDDVKVAASAQS